MKDLTAANQRIAELEEQLAELQRQVEFLTRQLFGKKSAPRRLAGAETDCRQAARRAKQP
jgi:predicted  nucleic acid-binding Zn-ribbon protein